MQPFTDPKSLRVLRLRPWQGSGPQESIGGCLGWGSSPYVGSGISVQSLTAGGAVLCGGTHFGPLAAIFFRPTPYGFRQVVQHVSKHVACEIN